MKVFFNIKYSSEEAKKFFDKILHKNIVVREAVIDSELTYKADYLGNIKNESFVDSFGKDTIHDRKYLAKYIKVDLEKILEKEKQENKTLDDFNTIFYKYEEKNPFAACFVKPAKSKDDGMLSFEAYVTGFLASDGRTEDYTKKKPTNNDLDSEVVDAN